MMRLLFAILLAIASPLAAEAGWPVTQGTVTLGEFRFASGETLPGLRLAYRTLGAPRRDSRGRIDNAVLILHGTGGSGAQFLRPQFADELFGPGQPLDIRRHYVILPDAIGHGGSSRPSDGLRMRFPAYDYSDMVEAQRRLLTEHLGVSQLKLIIGTSMGCMHAFVWGTTHPGFAKALMPLACLPVEIAGRNRMWRKLAMDAIRADPAWKGGDYEAAPAAGLRAAASLLVLAGAAPVRLQAEAPTRAAADTAADARVTAAMQTDANDLLYQLDSSRTYNPAPLLSRIRVPVTWVNSADDLINPPGLGIAEREAGKMPNARFVLIPETAQTHGHSTHSWAVFWKEELEALIARAGS